jgi:hypothetical protein
VATFCPKCQREILRELPVSAEEVLTELRRQVEAAGSQKRWAAEHGVSPAYLNDVLLGRRMLGPKIAAALCVTEATVYYWQRF